MASRFPLFYHKHGDTAIPAAKHKCPIKVEPYPKRPYGRTRWKKREEDVDVISTKEVMAEFIAANEILTNVFSEPYSDEKVDFLWHAVEANVQALKKYRNDMFLVPITRILGHAIQQNIDNLAEHCRQVLGSKTKTPSVEAGGSESETMKI